jgi:predicted metalloprotease with PDZ domain
MPQPAASGNLGVLSASTACRAVTLAHPVAYRIAPRDPHAHLFEVRCTVTDPDAGGQAFRLPVWIPGSYLIREFARHFVAVRAEAQGRPLAIVKEAKDTWRAAPCTTPVTVIAQIYAFDLSVRTAYLDASRGYFNGPAVFLCPDGRADRRCEVEIVAPDGDAGRAWRVATTLPGDERSTAGFGRYHAANYDELIDHPVEMSDFAAASFEAGGARHDIAVSGRHRCDLDRLARDLARVCQWQCDLFGGAPDSRAPFDRYLFQVTAVGDGYGGLEHRTSTSLLCKRSELPQPGVANVTDDYRRFLGLASHEYFHAWNVKRIKPAAFVPYDLGGENYTRQLWAFEGITSYYDDLALVRSGVIDHSGYLELLGRAITTVLRNPGRHVQSVADSSFDAWIKHYRRDENSPNAVVSYYAKGSLVALALDLILRANGSSLDAAMRALWQRFGRTGTGVPEDGIARLASELAGRDLGDFFARHVDGVEDPPLADLLANVGVTLKLRAAGNAHDPGGKSGTPAAGGNDGGPATRATFGFDLAAGSEPRLLHVYSGGPAERAGLAAGDVLVAVDGVRATAASIEALRQQRHSGDAFAIHAFRRDELFVVTLTLAQAPQDTCWLEQDDAASAGAKAQRDAWLGPGP